MSSLFEDIDPAYTATCSDVTLFSNAKGFFKNLAERLLEIADIDGWLDTFHKVEDGQKVTAVLENKLVMEVLTEVLSQVQPLHRGKDALVSQKRRLASEQALSEGDLDQALALASQAVLRAPEKDSDDAAICDGGNSLALALWLRSEILLKLGKPRAALEDLKLALKERLPVNMRPQYYWRMGHCYKGTGETVRAKVSYELADRLLGTDEESKSKLAEDIAALDLSVVQETPCRKPGAVLTKGAKLNIPSMSTLLKITEDKNKGRFAVANSEIRTGDVLLIDSPYAACLIGDFYGTHCLHCFKRFEDNENEAPVWCPKCSGVAFCSTVCRDTAVSTYHSYECPFLDLFTGSGMSVLSHIALRMVTQAGLITSLSIYSKNISNEMKTVEGAALNDIEGVAKKSKRKNKRSNASKRGVRNLAEKSDIEEDHNSKVEDKLSFEEMLEVKASQIYTLCTHSTTRKADDYFKRIIMALFLTECLKRAGYFKKCASDSLENAQRCITELIVRNMQLLQFNAHEIYETVRGRHMFNGTKQLYVAVGIYPVGALFNHECYPAVARHFEGRKIVLRAMRPLSPGDVVSENYGPHFMTRGLKERQRSLASRYWFKCECPACKEDWPTLKMMSGDTPPYIRCPNVSCTGAYRANLTCLPKLCTKCSTDINKDLAKVDLETVNRCVKKYQEGAQLMDEEKSLEAIAILTDAIDLSHEIMRPPHRDTHVAQEALRSCFAAYGNIHVVRVHNDKEVQKKADSS